MAETNTKTTANEEKSGLIDPMRRMLLSTIGSTVALAACAAGDEVEAKEDKEEVFSSYNRMRDFTNGEMDGRPWVSDKLGNFDLEDPVDNNLVKLKMTNNLVGKRTYIPMIVRMHLAREETPGGLLFGAAGMFTWQLQEPDPTEFPNLPDGTIVSRSMFTSRYLDPKDMEPVDRLLNPYNGKMMEVEDNIFAENFLIYPNGGGKFVEEPQFSNDDPNEPKFANIKKWGDELILFNGGVYSDPGIHQPRYTENMWRCDYNDVMDPGKTLIPMSYAFNSTKKAYEKPWAGYTTEDRDLMISLSVGKKVHSVEDIPDFHRRVMVKKYPNRV